MQCGWQVKTHPNGLLPEGVIPGCNHPFAGLPKERDGGIIHRGRLAYLHLPFGEL